MYLPEVNQNVIKLFSVSADFNQDKFEKLKPPEFLWKEQKMGYLPAELE